MSDGCEVLSASERAHRVIRDAIIDGSHVPGTMLGEASLAATMGMSRTPVRVALARLQDEGWVVVYPKRGVLVQDMSERTLVELTDARYIMETTGVERAVRERREHLAGRLAAVIEAQRIAFAEEDVRAFIEFTLDFHRGFVEAGGNAVMLELYDRLADRLRFALFAAGEQLLLRCAEIIAEHEALVQHLRAGDSAAFSATLHAHIAENGIAPAR